MKKLLLLLSFTVCCVTANAQTPNWLWAIGSGGGDYQYPNGIWVDKTDSLFISGRYASTISFGGGSASISGGNDNPFVGKLDSSGNGVWLQKINFGYYDYPWGFCIDNKSNVYSAGVVSSGASMFIMKYDTHGNLKYSITPSGGGIAGMGLIADGADNLYVTGAFQGNVTLGSTTLIYSGSGEDIYVAKLDSTGNFLWAKSVTGNGYYDVSRSITIDQLANVYISGGYGGSPTFGSFTAPAAAGGTSSLFIAEYDSSGNVVNLITAPNAGIDNGDCCTLNHITVDSCRNIYVTGYFENTTTFGSTILTSKGGKDVYLAQASNNGVWQWANDIGSTSDDYVGGITFDKNSDIYIGGEYSNNSAMFGNSHVTGGYYFVAKYANSDGALQWVQSAGNSSNGGGIGGITVDAQKYVYVTGDGGGGSIAFGSKSVNPTSNADIFVAKLDTVVPRTILPIIAKSYCPGSTDTIPYTIVGNFNNGNTFTVQLSDSTGSFINAENIGSVVSTTNGKIVIVIPSNQFPGSNYLIRVVSDSPSTSSYVNGCGAYFQSNVYINNFFVTIGGGGNIPALITAVPGDTICKGGSVALTASGGTTYLWFNGDTSHTIILYPTVDTTYSVNVSNGGCSKDTSINIVVNSSSGVLDVEPQGYALCYGSSVTLYVAGGGSNFTWSPAAGLNQTTGDSVIASPTATITYTVTGNLSGGCAATGTDEVDVIPAPNKPAISKSGDVLTSSATQGNQWYINDAIISGATNQNYTIATDGCYSVSTINPANGCTATSDTLCATPTGINQLLINSDQLSIYPNPTTGELFINISSSVMNIDNWNLQLIDVLGRIVFTRQSLSYSNDIDLSGLSGGVYFITIINKSGRAVFPVVKQN